MTPSKKFDSSLLKNDIINLSDKISELEESIIEKDKIIHRLRNDLAESTNENDLLHSKFEAYFENEKVTEITNKFSKILRWKYDVNTDAFWLSQEAYHIFKFDSKTCYFNFNDYLELIHPDDREYVIENFKTASKNSQGVPFKDFQSNYKVIRRDGVVRYMHDDYRYEYDELGEPVRGVGISRDITEEVESHKREQELHNDLKKALERANMAEKIGKFGHVEIDTDSYSFWASEGAREIMGGCENSVNSIDLVLERIHPDDLGDYLSHYTTALSQPGDCSTSLTVRFIQPDGSIKHVNTILFSFDAESKVAIAAMHDVTERELQQKREEELRKQLQISDKMKSLGLLVGGITHDFNNILASIITGAEYFSLNKKLTKSERTAAENIVNAGAHATSLTKQLLAFSRQNETDNVCVNLREVIDSSLSLVRQTIDSRIKVITEYNSSELFIKTDYSRFQALILNVCVNAGDALKEIEKPEIKFVTKLVGEGYNLPDTHNIDLADSEFVLMRISNNGEQIPNEIIDKIFDPFFTTKPNTEGTGLGLSMVFSTVESMNGYIFVDSGDGEDTSFSFYIPVDKYNSDSETGSHEIISGQGRILFVDDDENFRINTGFFLTYLGYDVDLCANGSEAIELLGKQDINYDLAIIDMIMPDMTGTELFEKICGFSPDLKVIMLSGQIGEHPLPENIARGLAMRLSKPIHTAELSQVIHKILS